LIQACQKQTHNAAMFILRGFKTQKVIRPKLPKVPNAHSYMGAIGLFGFDFKMCRSHSRSNVGAIGPFYLVLIKAVLYQFLSIILYISLFSLKMNHCLDYEANK
jgi:hypothetical protein